MIDDESKEKVEFTSLQPSTSELSEGMKKDLEDLRDGKITEDQFIEGRQQKTAVVSSEEDSVEDKRLDTLELASHIPIDKELSLEDLAEILNITVKRDWGNKIITFLVMLGTYTDEEQSNILFKSESSTGKSYIPLELIQYFPKEDVHKVSYASPTSFYHTYGTPFYEIYFTEDKNGKKKKQHRIKHYDVDMAKQIYIFKDMPSDKLLIRLRSLLSHDEKDMQIQITDRTMKYGFRARKVVIHGYPTFIFCTASPVLDAQESTRFFVLSPDIAPEKIEDGIRLAAKRKGNKPEFVKYLNGMVGRVWLQNRINEIKSANIKDVVVRNTDRLADKFIKSREHLHPRHMRDFVRLISLIKYWAIFNYWNRDIDKLPSGEKIIYANESDEIAGFSLYDNICDANEMGISPEVYQIYKLVLEKYDTDGFGLTKEQISANYLMEFHRPLSQRRLNKYIIPSLMASGLIFKDETTGKAGKPQKFKLSKNIDIKENGLQVGGRQILFEQLSSQQERLEYLLKVLTIPMKFDQIVEEVDGKILQKDIKPLLNILLSEGKLSQPNGYDYQRV